MNELLGQVMPLSFPYAEVATKLGVALGAGLLIGLERERAQKEVGVRTFSITALLGALTVLLSPGLLVGTLAGVLLLVAFVNVQSMMANRSLEMTTSISLVATLVLGAMTATMTTLKGGGTSGERSSTWTAYTGSSTSGGMRRDVLRQTLTAFQGLRVPSPLDLSEMSENP